MQKISQYILLTTVIFWPFLKASPQDYFQQEVNYRINVTLNDRKHELSGSESVEYINNSHDTLSFLFFHLWPNAYSDNKTALAKEIFSHEGKGKLFNDPDLRGYIDSLDFKTDGKQIKWSLLPGAPDICKLILNSSIYPGDTISITTPFHVKIPKGVTSRLGHIGESYQISQWYPKPAVFDKSGWHQMPYLDQGEFYSEFGSFDVSITLPDNYIVGATGNLQNEEEKKFLDLLSSDLSWMKGPENAGADFPISSNHMKTLRYTENQIHDFAWFADKRFHVLKGKIELPESGREVTTWAMFTNQESELWKNSIEYINNALLNFSNWTGDYPYNAFTAVQSALNSGSGMEYPGLTVIGLAGDPYLLDEVIAHEISHSWFYSAIGSDERRYPFMDESIASAYETRYMDKIYPDKKLWEVALRNRKLAKLFHIEDLPVHRIQEYEWLIPALNNQERPLNLASTDYTYGNYGGLIYSKGSQGFNYLRSYLGDHVFDTIMHEYYSKWKNKHPRPEDLRLVFESHTEKDLSWFFDDLLGTTKSLDYKMVQADNQKILVRNIGEMKAPLTISAINGDSVISVIWEDGFDGKKWIDIPTNNITELKIDPEHKMTELRRLNNNIHTSGLFRRADPVRLQFLYTIEDSEKRYLTYIPVFDWNTADGFMAGLALNNGSILTKKIEYFALPFFTFSDPGLAGYGQIAYNKPLYANIFRMVKFSLEGSQFGAPGNNDYHKARVGLDIYLTSERLSNPINKKIFGYYTAASDLIQIESLNKASMRNYLQFGYQLERIGIINPFNLLFSLESGDSFQKGLMELNYKYSYFGKKNGLDIRFFAGTMMKYSSSEQVYAFASSGRSGKEQYLYQGVYPDRFNESPKSFWNRQMIISEGGLSSHVNDSLGYSRWICSLSLSSTLPLKASILPIKTFITLLINDPVNGSNDKLPVFYEAGFKAGIWNFLEIYFPLFVSDNINSINGSLKERIRFVFSLDKLNPLKSKF